jgi:hypothetical protein
MDKEQPVTGGPIQRVWRRCHHQSYEHFDIHQRGHAPAPVFSMHSFGGILSVIQGAKYRSARTFLLVSEELPGILERWYRPPLTRNKGRDSGTRGSPRSITHQRSPADRVSMNRAQHRRSECQVPGVGCRRNTGIESYLERRAKQERCLDLGKSNMVYTDGDTR